MPKYIESKLLGNGKYDHDEVKAAHKKGALTEYDGWGKGNWVDVKRDFGANGRVIFYPDMRYRALVEGDMPALLPCPFCGSTNLTYPIPIDTYVQCRACHTMGPGYVDNVGKTQEEKIEEAIKLWNHRVK